MTVLSCDSTCQRHTKLISVESTLRSGSNDFPFLKTIIWLFRWIPITVRAVWRTCHQQKQSSKRTGKKIHRQDCTTFMHVKFIAHFKGICTASYFHSFLGLTVGARIVSIVHVACTRCLLGPPMSQLLCLMTQPRLP